MNACPTQPGPSRSRISESRLSTPFVPAHAAAEATFLDDEIVTLHDGALWVAPADLASSLSVRCVAGAVWLTQEGRAEDVVLAPGAMCLVPAGHGKVVVQALEDAMLRIEH